MSAPVSDDMRERTIGHRWADRLFLAGAWLFLAVVLPLWAVTIWGLIRCMWGMAMGYRAPQTLGHLLWGPLS